VLQASPLRIFSFVRLLRPGMLIACFVGAGLSAVAAEQHSSTLRYGPGDVYANIPERDELGRDQLSMFRAWNPDPIGGYDASLRAINPSLAQVVRRMQAASPGLRFVIGSGKRTRDLQRMAFAWGWSRTPHSLHQTGDAVDLWPLDADGHVTFDPAIQIRIGAAMKKAAADLGLSIRWGGTFHGFKENDRSHFELAPQ
jgi:peptidoglycan L-alanyl-D-glutamate endopeptidase CwlK